MSIFKTQSKRGTIHPATDEERDRLREEFEEIIISTSNHNGNPVFHIPSEDSNTKSICIEHTNSSQHPKRLTRKGISVYPKGWHDWCRNCLQVWREERDEYQSGKGQKKESVQR